MFFDVYTKICEERGVAPTTVLSKIGISKSAYSNWKSGGEPSNRTKKQIADYFGITVEALLGDKKESAPVKAEADEMDEILEEARRRPELRALFSLGSKAAPDEVRKYIKVIETLCGDNNGADNY